MTVGLNYFLLLSAGLFAIGCFGLLAKRNAVAMLMSTELMLNATNIALVAFARFHYQPAQPLAGQAFALFVVAVASAEIAVAIAILLLLARQRGSVLADEFNALSG